MVNRPIRSARRALALLDVLVAGLILSGALVAILGLASRATNAQIRGQQYQEAAQVLDVLATEVFALGPEEYPNKRPMSGFADPPFEDYRFDIAIDDQAPGEPYLVRIITTWGEATAGESLELVTLIAARLGEEPGPERAPETPIDR